MARRRSRSRMRSMVAVAILTLTDRRSMQPSTNSTMRSRTGRTSWYARSAGRVCARGWPSPTSAGAALNAGGAKDRGADLLRTCCLSDWECEHLCTCDLHVENTLWWSCVPACPDGNLFIYCVRKTPEKSTSTPKDSQRLVRRLYLRADNIS